MSNEQKVDRTRFPEDQSARVVQPMVISVSGPWPALAVKEFQDRIQELLGANPGREIQFLTVPETPQVDLISTIVRILEEEECSIRVVNRVKALRIIEDIVLNPEESKKFVETLQSERAPSPKAMEAAETYRQGNKQT